MPKVKLEDVAASTCKKQVTLSKFFTSSSKIKTSADMEVDTDASDCRKVTKVETKVHFPFKKRSRDSDDDNDVIICEKKPKFSLSMNNSQKTNGSKHDKSFLSVTDNNNISKSELVGKVSESAKATLLSFSTGFDSDRFLVNGSDNSFVSLSTDSLKRIHTKHIPDVDDYLNIDEMIPVETTEDSDKNDSFGESEKSGNFSGNKLSMCVSADKQKILDKFTSLKNKKCDSAGGRSAVGVKTKSKYTPLEQQFVEIKAKYADSVLFVECGYKYRFFGHDAEIAAEVLKIYAHPDHNFMTASIPTTRLFVHVRRLVAAGYKVGVVKQTETAALKAAGDNKNAPFTRKLDALYTKSTLIGEDVDPLCGIDTSDGNIHSTCTNAHLMCVCEAPTSHPTSKNRNIAIVSVQPATGDLVYDYFDDKSTRSELETRLAHIQPVELLLPESLSELSERVISDITAMSCTADDRTRVERLDDKVFDIKAAMDVVTAFYSAETNKASGTLILQEVLTLPKPVISCLAALITYLKEFHLEQVLISNSSLQKFSVKSHCMDLNANTVRNLELFRNMTDGGVRGTLFWSLDHTVTRFGSRLLRKWLAQPLLDARKIEERLDAVTEVIQGQYPEIAKLQDLLKKLPDLEKGLCSINHRKCSVSEFCLVTKALHKVYDLMSVLRETLVNTVSSELLREVLRSVPDSLQHITSFSEAIDEKAARENDKTKIFLDESQFADVVARKKMIADTLTEMHDHRAEVRRVLRNSNLNYVTVSGSEFLIEVKNQNVKQVPSDWIQINSTKIVSRFHTPFIVNKYQHLSQLREQLIQDCNRAWMSFLDEFSERYHDYRLAVQHLATLDCLFSLAHVAQRHGYCRPDVVSDECGIHIEQGCHPVIDLLLGDQQQYVPNDTHLDTDGQRAMIITGPNMGGKSSYIRQVALITVLAQMGSYVPAASARIGIVDAIYTRMGAADEIFQHRSTFMVELQEASEIMAQASTRSLVILDELGRGTSTHDGVAIAYATLQYFVTKVRCMTLFVTHYPPVAELADHHPSEVTNYHMSFMLSGDQDKEESDTAHESTSCITFLYQLVPGMAARSYGLNVARLAEIPKSILTVASEKSHALEDKVTASRQRKELFLKLLTESESSAVAELLQQTRVDL